ncbi:SMEK domain-containing protein [Paenibacillus taichungensis]|uniref:SMEK domain-containing protein n=1 Tax=Paenibacillus taichungensis TaxID=484184 RepID=UPI002DBA819A|nr:SMEK domain-containing protein [Paenibacillus taichungensis]MEC0105349.1 SMEK domain-containing protein [Paenibacillus taichungensis]MEC0200424.1 SMEK domain-containing protein [Paenibacillus taichungensis]
MLKREDLTKRALSCIGWLKNYIELNNVNSLTDINKYCEDFLVPILNRTYGLNLINLNQIEVNFPAVDLGDYHSRICYQVSSTVDIKKIEETLNTFDSNGLYSSFNEINMFMLGTKKSYRKKLNYDNFSFDYKKNVKDFSDLSRDILSKKMDELKEIVELLEAEMLGNKNNIDGQIRLIIEDELNTNYSTLFKQTFLFNGHKFRFRDVLNWITPEKFRTEQLFFTLQFMRLETEVYDKTEQLLIENPSEYTREIIEIYNQFKKLNKYEDLFHMRRDEYRELVRVLQPILNHIDVVFHSDRVTFGWQD